MESCQKMMGSGMMGSGMMGGDGMGAMHHNMMGMMDGMEGMDGMDGYGSMQKMMGFKSSEEFEKFLEDTKEQRRKLHDMRFEYIEKRRQPETTIGELKKMKQEMADLTKQIHAKVVK
jgi:predicted lipid-binding transport protein (Tim44 family)